MTPFVRSALVLGLLLTAAGCGEPEKERVTIMVPWTDTEFEAFYSVIRAFEEDHPEIDVEPQVTRALTQQLDAAVAADAAPDLAVLPSVGAIARYQEHGKLSRIEVDTGGYAQPFRGLGMKDGDVYAVPVKADVKSLVWYDAGKTVPPPPATWDALRARPERWCLGLESGPTSGWPGADWIADILLAEAGEDTYEDWAFGAEEWNSAPVEDAWTAWGDLVDSSPAGVTSRSFKDATDQMADDSCALAHGALSATDFTSDQVRADKYTYVPPSPDQVLQVSADFIGKFDDTDENADRLISYLASPQAQRIWVNEPGYALSANEEVTSYGNGTQGRIAGLLRSGHRLCFSAADAMDTDMSAAFYRAVLAHANDEKPSVLLDALDRVRTAQQKTPDPQPLGPLCGTPADPGHP